jgi:hypothetical protein
LDGYAKELKNSGDGNLSHIDFGLKLDHLRTAARKDREVDGSDDGEDSEDE